MTEDLVAREMAQSGLKLIEDAILSLLEKNPQGLGNAEIAEIADSLGLVSYFKGGQKNRLTHSVLGGLLERGQVAQDDRTKKFTRL